MALRNFWVEAEIDGRKTELAGGHQGKFGGMTIRLYQRKNGEKFKPVRVECMVIGGRLNTLVFVNGECVATVVTDR